MTDLEFHVQNCSACQKGLPCGTLRRLGGYLNAWRRYR